jgi:hypothetical protein
VAVIAEAWPTRMELAVGATRDAAAHVIVHPGTTVSPINALHTGTCHDGQARQGALPLKWPALLVVTRGVRAAYCATPAR